MAWNTSIAASSGSRKTGTLPKGFAFLARNSFSEKLDELVGTAAAMKGTVRLAGLPPQKGRYESPCAKDPFPSRVTDSSSSATTGYRSTPTCAGG